MPGEQDDAATEFGPARRRIFRVGVGLMAACFAGSVVMLAMFPLVEVVVIALSMAFWTVLLWLSTRRQP
jgi:hypothetical protein